MIKALVWMLLGLYGVPWAWKLVYAWGDRGLQ